MREIRRNKYLVKKYLKCIIISLITIFCFVIIVFAEHKKIIGLAGIAGVFAGFLVEKALKCMQDCTDITGWQQSLRYRLRKGDLKKQELIRISFAYLFRIRIGNKYLLVRNTRGTQKFQPVGGAYKFTETEKHYLEDKFYINCDSGIKIDNISKNDYRLKIRAQDLKKFVRRFNKTNHRETLQDLSREFREELISTGILNFSKIEYKYCGRHFTEIEFSKYFRCYELLMADIVELILDSEQEETLNELLNLNSDKYIFADSNEINSCGVESGTNELLEDIADHSYKILQETGPNLLHDKHYAKTYEVDITQ